MGKRNEGYVIVCNLGYYGGCDSYCRFYDNPGKAEIFPSRVAAEAVARDVLPLGEYFILVAAIANSY